MRRISEAKRPASSPPAPARISTITSRSSFGSLGSKRIFTFSSSSASLSRDAGMARKALPVDTEVVFSKPAAHSCDLLAVCVREGALAAGKVSDAHLHDLDRALGGLVRTCAEQEEFTGKEGQQLALHTHGK